MTGLPGRQRVRRRGPDRIIVRKFHRHPRRRRPAVLDVVGMIFRSRLQQANQRRSGADLLVVILQDQVIKLGTTQIDRPLDARRLDLHAGNRCAVRPRARAAPRLLVRPPAAWSPDVRVTGRSAAAAVSADAARPASESPAGSPAIPRSPGKAVFGPSMPHIPVDPIPFKAGHGIDTTFMPGIAAQDTLRCHRRASHGAMHPQRLHRVFAAAWPEAAMRADKRTDRPLIDADQANPKLSRLVS